MMAARILATGSALPKRRVTTRELVSEILPDADADEIEARIGIRCRHWLEPGETAAALAATALREALGRADLSPGELRRLVLVTSTGGDYMIPATATAVAGELGLPDRCDAFDLNNSCAGFLTALDLAARSVVTGQHPVAISAVETFSRHISPAGRRAYLVLGDAAAAAVLGPARSSREGFVASVLRTSSLLRGKMIMHHPGQAGARGYHEFDTRNDQIVETAISLIENAVGEVLDQAELELADIAWFLPHQPNGEIVRRLGERLGVGMERMVPVYPDAGSLGAASVPLSLDRVLNTRPVAPGDRLLLTAVGSGTAYGAMVYQVGP